jgi:hypothetical protein
MTTALAPRLGHRRHRWLNHLGRALALVIQLAFVVVPMSEGHEERLLGAHVEAPRSAPHPGHHPDWCPACQMLSVHGLAQQRAELPPISTVVGQCAAARATGFAGVELEHTNCSRAPPADL